MFSPFTTSLVKTRRASVWQSWGNSGALCVAAAVNTRSSRSLFGHWALCLQTDRRPGARRWGCRDICVWTPSVRPTVYSVLCQQRLRAVASICAILYKECLLSRAGGFSSLSYQSTGLIVERHGGPPCTVSNLQTVTGSCPAGCRATLLAIARRPRRRAGSWLSHSACKWHRAETPDPADSVSVFSLHEGLSHTPDAHIKKPMWKVKKLQCFKCVFCFFVFLMSYYIPLCFFVFLLTSRQETHRDLILLRPDVKDGESTKTL